MRGVSISSARAWMSRHSARFRAPTPEGSKLWRSSRALRATSGEHGILVRPSEPGDPADAERLEGMTIDDVLERHLPGAEPIDYLHISIEGSEPRALAAGGRWVERTRSLRIELHPYFGYGSKECIAQLEALGFRAVEADRPPETWVFGYERP